MSGRIGDLDSESLSIWRDKSRFPEEKPGFTSIDRRFLTALRGGSREGKSVEDFKKFLNENQLELQELSEKAKETAKDVCYLFKNRLGSTEPEKKLNKFYELINRPAASASSRSAFTSASASAGAGASTGPIPAHQSPLEVFCNWMIGRPIEDSIVQLSARIEEKCETITEQEILDLMNWCKGKASPLDELPQHTEKFLKARTDGLKKLRHHREETGPRKPPQGGWGGLITGMRDLLFGPPEEASEGATAAPKRREEREPYHSTREPERTRGAGSSASAASAASAASLPKAKPRTAEDRAFIALIEANKPVNEIVNALYENGWNESLTKDGFQAAIDLIYHKHKNSLGKVPEDQKNLIDHLKPLRTNAKNPKL